MIKSLQAEADQLLEEYRLIFRRELEIKKRLDEIDYQIQEIYKGDFPVPQRGNVTISREYPGYLPYRHWPMELKARIKRFLPDGQVITEGVMGELMIPREYLHEEIKND